MAIPRAPIKRVLSRAPAGTLLHRRRAFRAPLRLYVFLPELTGSGPPAAGRAGKNFFQNGKISARTLPQSTSGGAFGRIEGAEEGGKQ
jgi:hypothetical protein